MYDPQLGRFHSIDALSSNSPNESPFTFAMNNPIKYVDPLGLDTTTSQINHGKIQIKTNPEQGDVLKIVDGKGNVSYYTYDPDNPDANKQGYVGAGMDSKPEANVTVTAKKENSGVPPWLLLAQGELGTRRNGDGTNNPRVLEYLH